MRTAALALVALSAATVAAPGALAAPPKPITKTYQAFAPTPDPTNAAGGYTVCAQNVPGSFQIDEFAAPGPGTLKVELKDYNVDWDLLLMDAKANEIASSGNGGVGLVGGPEIAQVKLKKAGTVQIVACNWSGGPTATVTYTFTPAAPKR